MNKAIDFVLWLALEYPEIYKKYYIEFLGTLNEKENNPKTEVKKNGYR